MTDARRTQTQNGKLQLPRGKRVPHKGHSGAEFRIQSLSVVVHDSRTGFLDRIAWWRRIGSGRSCYAMVDCVQSDRPSDRALSNERETKGGERAASTVQRRCSKNEKQPEKKERGICGEGEDSRGRKRRYDRAFLVASIHVSSVTRVMSYVKEIRGFSSQAGTVLPFSPSPSSPLSLSLSLLSFRLAGSTTLFIIVYRHVRAREAKRVSSG